MSNRCRVVLLALLALAPQLLGAPAESAPGDVLWTATFDGRVPGSSLMSGDFVTDLAVSPDGSLVYVTGRSGRDNPANPVNQTFAYDSASGDVIWSDRYAPGSQHPPSLTVSPVGDRVFLTGESGYIPNDVLTLAYDARTGEILWRTRYDGPIHGYDYGVDVTSGPRGRRIYVLGASPSYYDPECGDGEGCWFNDLVTIAYRAEDGEELWARRFGKKRRYETPDVIVANRYSVVGADRAWPTSVVAYDARDGTQRWVAHPEASTKALALGPDGRRLFFAGDEEATGKWLTAAFSTASGRMLWSKDFWGPLESWGRVLGLAPSPDSSRLYVVGYVDSRVAATVAYDAASGTQLWASLYEGESPYYGASAAAVDVSQDGSTVFVGGGVLVGSAQSAYLTLAYSADTGDQRWLAIHDVGGDARQVLCCVAAGLGGVFVSGTAYVPVPGEQYPDPNYLTVAYDT